MEQLATLANTYGDFYAPSYAVRLGRADVMRDLLIPVSQIEVDLKLGTASVFSFTVTDCYDQELQIFRTGGGDDVLSLLKFGAEVEICMGYGDARSMPTAVRGVIKEIATSFPEGGSPELTISGMDNGYMLTLGTISRTWTDALDSDAVHDIASYNNLGADVRTTEVQHAQLEQNNLSDWAFLEKLAGRNHFEFYVDERKTLHFAPPNDKATAVLELIYGQGLLSFKPTANLAGQVSEVELFGWNPNTKKPIIGRARAGEESGRTGKSGGEILNDFVRDPDKRPTLRLRQPVFTQAEANQRAKAVLNECAKKFVTGEGEAIGLPEIRPDRNVKLSKLGVFFSRTYYIQQATHKIDTSGYRTRFNVKETRL
jgi:phage protein D